MKYQGLLACAAAAAASLLLGACGAGAPAHGAQTVPAQGTTPKGADAPLALPVQAVTVSLGSLDVRHQTAGTVQPVVQSSVAAEVGGVVVRTLKKAGDWVDAGEEVIELDDTLLRLAAVNARAALESSQINLQMEEDSSSQANPKLALQLQSAQAALSAAERSYQAQTALYKLGGTTESSLESAKSQLDQAKANLQAADTALDENRKAGTRDIARLKLAVGEAQAQLDEAAYNLRGASVRAPFAGQIVSLTAQMGEFIGADGPAFVLASRDRQVDFSVAPGDAASLVVGSEVRFSYRGADYPLRVTQSPAAPVSGAVPVIASGPAIESLPYGAVGGVEYSVDLAYGVLVPIAAIEATDNTNYVYLIENDTARQTPITIMAESGTEAAVSGIGGGASLVVNPPAGLIDGSPVRARGGT